MKRIAPILLITLILSGCSGLAPIVNLILSPTPAIPTETRTPPPTVTLIPTRDLFATLTPTPITNTPTPTSIVPQLPTQTYSPSLTPPSVSTSSVNFYTAANRGFVTILLSNSVIYWNSGPCMPRSIKVTAFVQDIVHTDKVYLMVRAREKSDTMLLEPWSSPAEMLQGDNGSFSYTITTDTIKRYYYHINAWLEYQILSLDKDRNEVARTQVFDRNITLVMCRSFSP